MQEAREEVALGLGQHAVIRRQVAGRLELGGRERPSPGAFPRHASQQVFHRHAESAHDRTRDRHPAAHGRLQDPHEPPPAAQRDELRGDLSPHEQQERRRGDRHGEPLGTESPQADARRDGPRRHVHHEVPEQDRREQIVRMPLDELDRPSGGGAVSMQLRAIGGGEREERRLRGGERGRQEQQQAQKQDIQARPPEWREHSGFLDGLQGSA